MTAARGPVSTTAVRTVNATVRPSRFMALAALSLALLFLLSIMLLSRDLSVMTSWLILLAGVSVAAGACCHAWRGRITAISVAPGVPWQFRTARTGWCSGRALGFARGAGWLRVKMLPCNDGTSALAPTGRPFWFTLWRDSMPAPDWRRLQLIAMWQGQRSMADVRQQEYV
ncbi:hypothetical protein FMZ60_10585 [Alcaligenaceae bacterium SJ-26]|nr:hypothetical protein FMZ60_10585 [Alcaligenaceae bacterium SJ-26]